MVTLLESTPAAGVAKARGFRLKSELILRRDCPFEVQ